MFGVPNKDKIKAAFLEFEQDMALLTLSSDPVVRTIVKFIVTLSQAFK